MKKWLVFLISGILLWETIRLIQKSGNGLPVLSYREREILSLMAEGHTDDAISAHLHVDRGTLEKYFRNIPKRLNLPDMPHAIDYAIEKGLVRITYA